MSNPKRCSVVYALEEALRGDSSLGGPESDYLKWLDGLLFAEIGCASDEADWEKNSQADREAWRIYGDAVAATQELLQLRERSPAIFRKIARHFSVIPCFLSRHPETERFNRELFKDSQLGEESMLCEQAPHGRHYAHQSWPVRYAYALITTIHLTLDTWGDRLWWYAEIYGYGREHPIPEEEMEEILAKGNRTEEQKEEMRRMYRGAYRILPEWTKGLERIRRPFSERVVLEYWRKGKEIMLEEIPDFHLRPEWKAYHTRHYKDGAKPGAIQHAIFKDILAALKTIAGRERAAKKKPVRRAKKTSG